MAELARRVGMGAVSDRERVLTDTAIMKLSDLWAFLHSIVLVLSKRKQHIQQSIISTEHHALGHPSPMAAAQISHLFNNYGSTIYIPTVLKDRHRQIARKLHPRRHSSMIQNHPTFKTRK